jgi:hypothetical protein
LPARAQNIAHEQIVLAQLQTWPQTIHVRPQSSDGCIWTADLCHYLNPNDLTNRVFLHYAGEEIDLDAALATLPSDVRRAELVAKNPKAQSDFFQTYVQGFVRHVLGWDLDKNRPMTRTGPDGAVYLGGILGVPLAHFGVTECQNRGSLHLHMLCWIQGATSTDVLNKLLQAHYDRKQREAAQHEDQQDAPQAQADESNDPRGKVHPARRRSTAHHEHKQRK